jgi:hypothetical protein
MFPKWLASLLRDEIRDEVIATLRKRRAQKIGFT